MKKDIPIRKVTDVAIAMVPDAQDENFWEAYIINLKDEAIKNVLITSKGYGEVKGEKITTTQLRYFYEIIGPEMAVKIEPIDVKLLTIANEYWISFNLDDFMYDKKYVFMPGSSAGLNRTTIPILNQRGIMIK